MDSPPPCIVNLNGQVNCSDRIYHDRKIWKQSRHQIDSAIQTLKQKLERLKEIRRHLKHTKPNVGEDKDIKANTTEILSTTDLVTPFSSTTERLNFENFTRDYLENVRTTRRKGNREKTRRRFRVESNETAIDFDNSTRDMFYMFNLTTEGYTNTESTSHRPIRCGLIKKGMDIH